MPKLHRDDLYAATSGLLLALSFPLPGLWFLSWFALVPWLMTFRRRPFRSGFICGFLFFAIVLYWVNIVMTRFGQLHPLLALVPYFALAAYLALYFALVSWGADRLQRFCRLPFWFGLPLLWVAAEYLRAHLLTGFPWASLGYSQQPVAALIQTADIWGVYGVGLLVFLGNLLLSETIRLWRASGCRRGLLPLLAFALLLASAFGYGDYRLADLPTPDRQLKVALIQGNIDQGVKWNPAYQQQTLEKYRRLTLEAASEHPELIVWPESATPFFFQDPSSASQLVRNLPVRTGAAMLIGSPAYERDQGVRYFNSAYLLDRHGRTLGRSDKVHLVPFGEYVPLKWLLPFIDKLVVGIGDFSPGTLTPLKLADDQLGVLVCYEVIFPELARTYVERGAGLLLNITNDAWFGRSSAPYQHLEMAALRAVENRVWVARAANTGISAYVDPGGHIHQATELYTDAYRVMSVGVGAGGGIYLRYGDLLPQAATLLSIVLLGLAAWRKKRTVGST